MTNITLTAQNVNGDPYLTGGNINIINNSTSELTFIDTDHQLNDPLTGEFVSFDSGATLLTYEYLGTGDVRDDPMQSASFIRIDMGDGTFVTVALDLNADFDDLPDLQNGNTGLTAGPGGTLDADSTNWFPGFACFTSGALIDTDGGLRIVDELVPGDLIVTADHGLQPLLHLARKRVLGLGALAPVRIEKGAMGNDRELVVSQQHRMLVSGWQAQLICGEDEVFVPAKHLVNGQDIYVQPRGWVEYYHLLFAEHEVIFAEGIPSESYFPGKDISESAKEARQEAALLFPELEISMISECKLARRVARGPEVCLLAA